MPSLDNNLSLDDEPNHDTPMGLDDLLDDVSKESNETNLENTLESSDESANKDIEAEATKVADDIQSFMNETQDFGGGSMADDGHDETHDFDEDNADFDLQSLLNEVREEADNNGATEDNGSSVENTVAEKRWMQLCGNNPTISAQKEVKKVSFSPENHMLKAVLDKIEAIKGNAQLFRLKYNNIIIVLDDTKNKVYCSLPITSDEYSEFCFTELDPSKIKIHDLDYSEVRLYEQKMVEDSDNTRSIESFIWITSLLTSRGRLPEGTDVTKKVGLKVWPNLTRAELMPNAMQMAAVFNKHPGSLLEIAKLIDIEQRYVFAFYNAVFALDMIESDQKKLKKMSTKFNKKKSKGSSEERGFFGRLLNRLKS